MAELIRLNEYPVDKLLPALLKDKTTKRNIIFATDAYAAAHPQITAKTQITPEILLGLESFEIQPRVLKTQEEQVERTRKKAEVFTPAWICNKMNNHCDTEWFGREGVFNTEKDQDWEPTTEPVQFGNPKDWQKYVDSKRLEITCGEAPYIVSRYDASTGEMIDLHRRIGILDRKLRIVNENTDKIEDWTKWATRAFQSVYGFEYQGDSLLIARINLLLTYMDYKKDKFAIEPELKELQKIVNIITWNLWQMDGITGTVPFGKPKEENRQLSFFDYAQGINDSEQEEVDCRIFDWRSNESITYKSIKGK